mmetsp:Transcript_72840/g.167217  ORF Transcript_72840/g.167217 Transcript_72840/m.167217 type:complete len:207 (-) Transcript_72840:7-627(-)
MSGGIGDDLVQRGPHPSAPSGNSGENPLCCALRRHLRPAHLQAGDRVVLHNKRLVGHSLLPLLCALPLVLHRHPLPNNCHIRKIICSKSASVGHLRHLLLQVVILLFQPAELSAETGILRLQGHSLRASWYNLIRRAAAGPSHRANRSCGHKRAHSHNRAAHTSISSFVAKQSQRVAGLVTSLRLGIHSNARTKCTQLGSATQMNA